MPLEIENKEFLKEDFDYKKLTKPQLREIMSKLNIEDIPSLYSKKDEILKVYKKQVHDRLKEIDPETLTFVKKNRRFSMVNDFQSSAEFKAEPEIKKEIKTTQKPVKEKVIKQKSKNVPQKTDKSSDKQSKTKNSTVDSKTLSTISEKLKSHKHKMRSTKFFKILKYLVCLILTGFIVYLKFFIPYCTKTSSRYCVFVPLHGHLIDSKLFCDSGYRKVTSIIDHCEYDTRIEHSNRQKAVKIIKNLEQIKGEYLYGLRDEPKIDVREISANDAVLSILKSSDMLVFEGKTVEALNKRISIGMFIKFYTVKMFRIMGILIFMGLLGRILYYGKVKRNQNKAQAQEIIKDVLKSLNKQAFIAAKTDSVSSLVYSVQLQEVFEVKDDVWTYVEEMLKENANVSFEVDEHGELRFKWVGVLLFRSTSNSTLMG